MSSYNKKKQQIEPGELTLALNAAEGRLQLVLGRAGREAGAPPEIMVAQDWSAVAQGAELLTPALQQALDNLRLSPAHLGKVAAVTGPGGFTGLRLACVTAAALSRALGIGQAGLDYLPLLAAGAFEAHGQCGAVWVFTHARRGLVYAQGFAAGAKPPAGTGEQGADTAAGLGLAVLEPLRVLALEQAVSFMSGRGGLLVGSGLSANLDALQGGLLSVAPDLRLMPGIFDQPPPALLLRAALLAGSAAEDLLPSYVRPSDAEENLESIAGKLGLDGKFARSRLAALLSE